MNDMILPDFNGKIVSLYFTNSPEERSVIVQNARFELQGGRLFLVGEVAEGTSANDWAAGVRTAVAWDRIEQYMVFDSIQNYLSRVSLAWEEKAVQ